jgi:hypothetical protein
MKIGEGGERKIRKRKKKTRRIKIIKYEVRRGENRS